jgi:hypothetical protein
MTRVDLFAELRAAADRVGDRHLNQLVRMGVGWGAIDSLSDWGDVPFGIATGSIVAGLFEPGDGAPHIVQPVVDRGDLVDLVYWRSDDPAHWSLRMGEAWALGTSALSEAIDDPTRPLMLCETPLDWLRAESAGLTVLDWRAPEVPLLRNAPRIIAPTDEIAALLRRALTRHLDLPLITIGEEVRHAA